MKTNKPRLVVGEAKLIPEETQIIDGWDYEYVKVMASSDPSKTKTIDAVIINGVISRYSRWAKFLNVSPKSLRCRIRSGSHILTGERNKDINNIPKGFVPPNDWGYNYEQVEVTVQAKRSRVKGLKLGDASASVVEWANHFGIPCSTLRYRIANEANIKTGEKLNDDLEEVNIPSFIKQPSGIQDYMVNFISEFGYLTAHTFKNVHDEYTVNDVWSGIRGLVNKKIVKGKRIYGQQFNIYVFENDEFPDTKKIAKIITLHHQSKIDNATEQPVSQDAGTRWLYGK